MLSKITSVEIPALEETLIGWLNRQSDQRLIELGIERAEVNDRTFYPRLLLGEFFFEQLLALIAQARDNGIIVTLRTHCRVLDAVSTGGGMVLTVQPRRGERFEETASHRYRPIRMGRGKSR